MAAVTICLKKRSVGPDCILAGGPCILGAGRRWQNCGAGQVASLLSAALLHFEAVCTF